MKLFFDTETSGKADFKAPATASHQPRLLQLAAILTKDDCEEISTIDILVKPEGWSISPEAVAVHGITNELATEFGLQVKGAVGIFVRLCQAAQTMHAYNKEFDRIIMENEISRIPGMPNPFETGNLECEMVPMTNICKIPGRFGQFKWPSLIEAHTFCYGKPFEDAHDALGDVRAMIAVHKWRITSGHPRPVPSNSLRWNYLPRSPSTSRSLSRSLNISG